MKYLALVLLSGCSTTIHRDVEWYPVQNIVETCNSRSIYLQNNSGCLEKHSGTDCVIWTKDRSVSYSDLGALTRACFE